MIGWIVLAVLAGLAFGSAGSVLVERVPRKEPPTGRSRCPACRATLRPSDLIPVVSWLMRKGRCAHCGERISPMYPAIELITATLFGLGVAVVGGEVFPHAATDLIAFLPLFWVLVVLSFIDLRHKILPNRIVIPSFVAGVALVAIAAVLDEGMPSLVRALIGALVGFVLFFVLALISPRGMGMGDVKLAAVLGLCLGYISYGVLYVGFLMAFLLGAVGGILLILLRRAGMKSEVPFGPYLALGTVIAVLWGWDIGVAVFGTRP